MADHEAPPSSGAPAAPEQSSTPEDQPSATQQPAETAEVQPSADSGAAAVSTPEASPEPAPAEGVTAAAADVPASEQPPVPEGAQGDEATASSAGEASASATAAGAEAPEGATKRKRRRKRKRKGAAEGEEGASAEGEGQSSKKKKDAHIPFGHLFSGGAKRHAFSVGEVIAGRVVGNEHGAIVVDLFGKALAIADEFEPREVPPAPVQEAAPEAEAAAETASDAEATAVEGASDAEATAVQGAQADAEAPAAEDATATATGAEPTGASPAQAALEAPGGESVAEVGESVAETAPTASEAEGAQTAADAQPATEPGDAAPLEAAGESVETAAGHVAAESSDEETSSGEVSSPRSNLPPAPVVPEDGPRPEPVALGAIFRGRVGAVSESGHIAILNRNVDVPAVRTAMEQYRNERRRVEGLVFGFNRGGFDVLVGGIRGFCPASAMSLSEIGDPNEFVGRKFQFLLPQAKPVGKDVIVTRRSILEREARKKAKELLKNLKAGMRIKGQVSSVREFGLFVDIGGIEGLVHQSELSYVFGVKPQDVAKPGEEIEVQVLRVGGGDKKDKPSDKKSRDRTTRVSLSIKALQPDPWDAHAEAIAEGTVRAGKVTRTTDFGAFIELAPGIEGLLHISELGRDLKHASQALKDGDELHVVVERADRKARRISLSRLSDAELQDFKDGKLVAEGEAPKSLRTGAKIKVTIDRVEQRGIHVRIPGVIGKRARGYLPGSETGLERGADLRKGFPLGEEIEVKVIGTDRDGGVRCSVKALQIDEERKAIKDYRREASKQGFGTFGDLLKAKLGG